MSISLSRNGKNSGGQGETSYYIIRSINLQSALRPSETNSNSLESIIIDEISNTRSSGFPKINIIDNDKTIISWTDSSNKLNVKTILLNNSYFD